MKKLAIAMMMGIAAMSASAQVNYKMQVACNPQDVKTYNTNRLRSSFLMEKVMVPDQINVTYSCTTASSSVVPYLQQKSWYLKLSIR